MISERTEAAQATAPGSTSAGSPAIEIRDLRVDYGDFVAVDEISLSIPYGEVCGLVGPNGAGKTSTFLVLATLMEPTYGEVSLGGLDIFEQAEAARRILGYMPDLAPVPSDLRVWEFLDFYADTHGLGNRAERRGRVTECLAQVDLMEKEKSWCKALSRGQTQRLVLAKTLLHRPRVLILDEPASGLDPLARRDLRLTLQKLAREGAAVLVSSHILSELSEMCSSIVVMNQGKLLASGSADEVRRELSRTGHRLIATLLDNAAAEGATAWLQGRGGINDIAADGRKVTFSFEGTAADQADLLAAMVAAGLRIAVFEESSSSFEDILVDVAEQNREGRE